MNDLFRMAGRILLPFFFLPVLSATSQNFNENDQSLPLFDHEQFEGRFCISMSSDADFDYYVVNLDLLENRFEKVYFLNLTYLDGKIVNIDPDISKRQLWFKSYYLDEETEILKRMDDLLRRTRDASLSMSDVEKETWLKNNDKLPTK